MRQLKNASSLLPPVLVNEEEIVTEFRVSKEKKRAIDRKLYQNRGIAALKYCKRLFICLTFLAPASFLVYAYLISDSFVYLHDRYGTLGQKNSLLIWIAAGAIAVGMLIFELAFSILAKGLANRETQGRFAETLYADGGHLRYCYRNYMNARPNDMVVVEIDLDRTVKAFYRPLTRELAFSGTIRSTYYDDYGKGISHGQEDGVIGRFSIYDYFCPSLYEYLKREGIIQIREEN